MCIGCHYIFNKNENSCLPHINRDSSRSIIHDGRRKVTHSLHYQQYLVIDSKIHYRYSTIAESTIAIH